MKRACWTSLATAVVLAAACGDDGSTIGDNFDQGEQPLSLLPAPGGLCNGDGAPRQCEDPGTCDPTRGGSGDPGGGTSGGTSPAPGGGGASFGSAPTAGFPSGTGGGVTDTNGSVEPPPPADGSAGPSPTCTDGGLPDGGACSADAGSSIRQTAQALERTGCSALDRSSHATLYLSADDSNSTASATIARGLIRDGRRVPPEIIRPYEFLNYYDFSFEPAAPGEVRIVPQLSSCPMDGELSFQVALQGEARDPDDRRPLNVTFVLDTSGSMSGEPIALQRAAVRAVAGELRQGDVVSMVTWNVDQREVMTGHRVAGPDDPTILSAADALAAGGGTDLDGGLRRGYSLAEEHYGADRINRVIVISDGRANVGQTNEELIGRHADDEEGEAGIYLAGVGVGDGVNDSLMDVVTDAGRGAYVYLDNADEAEEMMGDRFLEVVDVAARAVRLELDLPWYLGVEKFYGEEISTDPTQVRPQHLAPNSAMLFFQILKACDPSLLHGDDRIRMRATWETPFLRQSRQAVIDTTLNALAGDDAELTKAAAIAGYAEALIRAGSADDPEKAREALQTALETVRSAKDADSDPDLIEIAGLIERYMGQL